MNLIQTIKAMPPLKIVTDKKEASRLFLRGVEKHQAFDRSMKQARKDAIESGFYFLRARAAFEHGDWTLFCDGFADKISARTIQFYMLLAERQAAYVRFKHPAAKTLDEIIPLCVQEVMLSPAPLVQLCRELGQFLKFGGYFPEDHEKKKLRNASSQIEFAFDELLAPLDHLVHFGEENYTFKFPEGRDESEFIDEALEKFRAVVKRLEQVKQHGRVIEA